VPPCPLRTILTSNDPPEDGKTDFLKFLALGPGRVVAALTRSWPGGCGIDPVRVSGVPGPARGAWGVGDAWDARSIARGAR